MKKIIFSLTLLLFVLNLFSQVPATPNHSSDYYLKKSKNQKKVANRLLVGGALSILTAFLIPEGEETNADFPYIIAGHRNDAIIVSFMAVGVLSMLGSTPFYLLSSKNKRKANAVSISFNNQRILSPKQHTFVSKKQPELTLKILF